MKSFISIVNLLVASAYLESFANEPGNLDDIEKKKAKIVTRLYQATFGSMKRCQNATTNSAKEFDTEVHHFIDLNANLVKLVTQSPYYNDAREKFSQYEPINLTRETPESLAEECKSLTLLLHAMNYTPNGRVAVKEYEDLLSK